MPTGEEFVDWSLRSALELTFPGTKILRRALKVCLGAGSVAPSDWVCVDRIESYPVVDAPAVLRARHGKINADIRDVSWIPDNSVDVVYAHHVIEHLPIADWTPTLTAWVRILKPGGLLYLCQPDLAAVAARILEGTEPGTASAWFAADPEHRTWPGDEPAPLKASGHTELSAWYWLYLGGDHRSVPTGIQIRSVLEPLGMEVRRAKRRLVDLPAEHRLAFSLEGCFVARKPG